MFCGREAYTAAFATKFVEARLLAHPEEVDQAVADLSERGLLRVVRVEEKRGRPRIRTADLTPLYQTLKRYSFTATQSELEAYLKPLDKSMDHFPEYVAACLPMAETTVRNLRWELSLALFCQFVGLIPTLAAFPRAKNAIQNVKAIEPILEYLEKIEKALASVYRRSFGVIQRASAEYKSPKDLRSLGNLANEFGKVHACLMGLGNASEAIQAMQDMLNTAVQLLIRNQIALSKEGKRSQKPRNR